MGTKEQMVKIHQFAMKNQKKDLLEAIEDTIIWLKRLFCQCENKTVIKKWVYKEHTIYKMKCLNCGKIKF